MATDPPAVSPWLSIRRWRIALLLLALLVGVPGYWYWPDAVSSPEKIASRNTTDDDLTVAAVTNPGYVGSQACEECHTARFGTFKQTRHHWACTAPEDRPMPAAFDKGESFASSEPSVRFAMTRENGTYVQQTIKTTPSGRQETSSPIGLVYGHGGQFDEVYFTWRENRLFELPVTWLHPEKEWANVTLNPHQNGDFSRVTTTRCVECHATWVGHVPGTPNEYHRDTAIFGVGCERCHGPARDHIALRRENPKAASMDPIVHPGALNRDQRTALCAQCHSNAAFPADLPFTHRPGQPLEKSYKTLVSRFPEDDHVANQTKYMKESKCFQHSEMTCLTCHNPHKPTDHREVADSCLKCHQPANCKEQPRLPAEVRDNCTGCHLPARVWMNVHFHTDKDRYIPPIRRYQHRIAVYPEATQEVLLAWKKKRPDDAGKANAERLTKSLVDHWVGEADKYRTARRFHSEMRAMREALFFDPSPGVKSRLHEAISRQSLLDARYGEGLYQMDQKKYPAAAAAFVKMLELDPDSAKAHARLGTINGMLGKHDAAVAHLRKAATGDPNDPYPLNMLGWMAYVQNRPAEAVQEYLTALNIDPTNDAVLYRLGLAYLALDKMPEGRAAFERLYKLNPSHAGGCQGLSHVLRRQGEFAESVRFARRAAKLTESRHADILLSLCGAYADAGRRSEAIETAELALRVADNPEITTQLRQLLTKLRDAAYSTVGR